MKVKIVPSPRPETREEENKILLKGFRDALTEISNILHMPGSPSLISDVPKEVSKYIEDFGAIDLILRKVERYADGDVRSATPELIEACQLIIEKRRARLKLARQDDESVYDYEDRLVRHFVGDDACLERTSNGAPWMMPCSKKRGHDGECHFQCDFIELGVW